jgi:hypothetical protein
MERCNGVEGLPEQPVIYHRLDHLAVDRAALPLATPGRPDAARPFVSRYASSASFKVNLSLRPPDPPSEWQDSWGFWGGPVDRPSRGKPENRSPRANFL